LEDNNIQNEKPIEPVKATPPAADKLAASQNPVAPAAAAGTPAGAFAPLPGSHSGTGGFADRGRPGQSRRPGDSNEYADRSSGRFSSEKGASMARTDEGGLEEIVIKIGRVTKVVKGGKRMSFSALVAVGDRNGNVGYGKGNANEVPFAVEKAVKNAKKNMSKIAMKDTTLPHRTIGKFGATTVLIRPACPGTGIIAGSAVRAILELIGIKDVLAKVMGSTNPTNVVKATMNALSRVRTYHDRRLLLKKD
jgi:small subunit ribosomal protein S5